MKKILVVFGFAVLTGLVGCSSGVKLDPPVEDVTATQVNNGGTMGQGGGGNGSNMTGSQTGVTQVDLGQSASGAGGPANVAKIIYFDYDSFQIRPEFGAVLEAHARWLTANKARRAALEGHTDSVGGREYNLALGQKRAESVRRALTLLGVSDQQLEAVSFGEEKPADGGNGDAAMAKNRRVEVFYR